MKTLRKNRIFIILFCTFFLFSTQIEIYALSIEGEKKQGEEFLYLIKKHLHVIEDDPFVNKFINDLGQYLVKSVETKHFDYRFFVIKEDELNAFAGPGGVIFFYTDLIKAMDEVDELASVMCHEIAHVSRRHILHQGEQSAKLRVATMIGLLAGIFIGGEAGEAAMIGSLAAVQQKQLSYSRDAERQADQTGFKYTAKSGFNPASIKSALLKLQEGRWGAREIPSYLLTHPIGPERISNIDSMLSSPYVVIETPETIKFRKLYPIFRTIIMAKYCRKDDMVNYFTSEVSKDADSPLANLGLGILLKDDDEYSKAIVHLKKAIEGLAEPLPVLQYLSEAYLHNGEPEKATATIQKILSKNGNDKASLLTLAKIYQKIEKYSYAIKIYEKLKLMGPVEDGILYNLGYVYGKQSKLDFAHYNFGLFYNRVHNIKEAKFHFEEAKKAAANNPELFKKIEESLDEIKDKKDKR